ncbi:CHRD domain-containing protein [Lihuaxuella thermophila]|uniref:CHRD domain-containing protein n=1 Tax=Lihuaxuella thermophila TaxID=1173111 RepID=A0A1H8E126_9BACL|nr:CHRD domain-containing protein [Lihuaxuella thermophila]SEN13279.1 CHRD domain-containing protein [Lihuaxuella thermophila]
MHKQFFAFLLGAEEVPPVRTPATGSFIAWVNKDRTKIHYRLNVENIRNMTQAHIHLGARGVNGPVVADLFRSVKRGISVAQGCVNGTITRRDLVGPLRGKSIASLVECMKKCKTYVNVHTEQNPNGEIRGQIVQRVFELNKKSRQR